MAYFRFIPTPYKDLKDQGLLLWYDIPPKMYLQNLNTIEKLSGNDINNLYNKKHFYNLMENDYRSKNFEIIKNNLLNDKNISNFFIEIIYRVNFFTYFFVKIFIFICLPLVMIIFLLNYSLSIFTKKNIFEESLLLSSILMSLIGFGSIIVSLFLFYDERHIMMHLILFSPLTMYLFLKLKTFFKNKSQKNH